MLNHHLHIVVLVKATVGRVFHDLRVRIGEVVLVFVSRAGRRWFWLSSSRFLTLFRSFFFPFPQFGLIFRLFRLIADPGAICQDLFRFSQTGQSLLTTFYLIVNVHILWHSTTINGFSQSK